MDILGQFVAADHAACGVDNRAVANFRAFGVMGPLDFEWGLGLGMDWASRAVAVCVGQIKRTPPTVGWALPTTTIPAIDHRIRPTTTTIPAIDHRIRPTTTIDRRIDLTAIGTPTIDRGVGGNVVAVGSAHPTCIHH
jgi:hypothetical protein